MVIRKWPIIKLERYQELFTWKYSDKCQADNASNTCVPTLLLTTRPWAERGS